MHYSAFIWSFEDLDQWVENTLNGNSIKKKAESKVSINTSPFINGVYIIQVDDKEKNILSEKLIISQ